MALEETFTSILGAAKQGADWAWERLFRDYAGRVTGYLASRGAAEPEDITADVFLQISRKIHDFDGDESSFRSWVFVIAHRRLIDEHRARARLPEMTGLDRAPDMETAAPGTEDEVVALMTAYEMAEVFESLTDGQRDVLSLRMIGGLTLAETAETLGKSVGAVKVTQHRAVEALRGLISSREVTP